MPRGGRRLPRTHLTGASNRWAGAGKSLKGKLAGTAPSAALPEAGSTVQPVKVEEVDTELEELKRSIDKL